MPERLQPSQPFPASASSPTIGNLAAFHRAAAGSSRDGPNLASALPARIESSEVARLLSVANVKSIPIELQQSAAAAALMDQASAFAARFAGSDWGAVAGGTASPQATAGEHVPRPRINEAAAAVQQSQPQPQPQLVRAPQQPGGARTHGLADLADVRVPSFLVLQPSVTRRCRFPCLALPPDQQCVHSQNTDLKLTESWVAVLHFCIATFPVALTATMNSR